MFKNNLATIWNWIQSISSAASALWSLRYNYLRSSTLF